MYRRGGNLPPATHRYPSRTDKTVSRWMYRWGGPIQPHRLYSQRGGRQIAAPTSTYHVFDILRTQNDDRHVEFTVIRNKCNVGAATCRPLRIDHRAVPTKRYPAGCADGVVPFTRTGYRCNVAGGRLPPLHPLHLTVYAMLFVTKMTKQ